MSHFPLLIQLKLTLFRNAMHKLQQHSPFEFITLILFFVIAAAGLFLFFYFSFRFFRGQEPFGRILIDESFYLFNFALFTMLFISTAVASYTSLFRSGEVPFLITRPVDWADIYFIRLGESLWFSSWSFLFVALPFMTAYGITKHAAPYFPFLCLVFYIPFILLAGMLGCLVSLITVWLLPNPRRQRFALILTLLIAGVLILRATPHAIKEQGTIAGIMSGYLPHIAFAKNALLPSSWTTRGILALSEIQTRESLDWQEGVFYLLVLLSNALFFLIPSYSVAKRLFPPTYLKSQDYGQAGKRKSSWIGKGVEKIFDSISWPSRPALAFLEKDIKNFLRDPSEWSQLIIFFGLLLFYFLNLKNLEFHVLKDFWKNLIFILNTLGTYIVLSSFNMRFVFPMLSLEGLRSWMIGLAPIRFSSLLLEKFLLGTVISLILTVPLVFLSGWMLEIPLDRVLFVTSLGFFVCLALTGLSVGLGAKFPNFKSNNPAEIISGFGGSMLLVCHLAYLSLVGLFLMMSRQSNALIFWTASAASLLVAMIPLKIGVNSLARMEF